MKIGRNAPCPCGSGKKYKRCCLDKNAELAQIPIPNYEFPNLQKSGATYTFIKRYDKIELLKLFSILQLYPQNQGKYIRIEYAISNILKTGITTTIQSDLGTVKEEIISKCKKHYLEDPPEDFFTGNIIFYNGNNTVFNGIAVNGVEIVQTLLDASNNEHLFSSQFRRELSSGVMFLLHILNSVADKLELTYNVYEEIVSDDLYFPDVEQLNIHKEFLKFTKQELELICLKLNIPYSIISEFSCELPLKDLEFDSLDNPLYRAPFVIIENFYYLIVPSAELICLNEFIIRTAQKHNCYEKLVTACTRRIEIETAPRFGRMHWKKVQLDLSDVKHVSGFIAYNDSLYQFDEDKFCHVFLCTPKEDKELIADSSMERNINERFNQVSKKIKSAYPHSKVLLLFMLNKCRVLSQISLGFKKMPNDTVFLSLSSQELKIISSNYKLERLSLWKYAKYYDSAMDKIHFSPYNSHIAKYYWFERNGESFLDPDKEPYNFIVLDLDIEGNQTREALTKIDKRGIKYYLEEGKMLTAPCVRAEQHYPVYISEEYQQGKIKKCLLKYKCPIWVISSRLIDPLSDVYVNGILYWLNDMYPILFKFVNSLGAAPITILIDLEEKFYGKRDLDELGDELPVFQSNVIAEDRVMYLFIPYQILKFIVSPDNSGERMIISYLLDLMGQLIEKLNLGTKLTLTEKENILEKGIPLGNRKMIISVTGDRDITIAQTDLVDVRYIPLSDLSFVLENQLNWLKSSKKIPTTIKTSEEKCKLFNDLVGLHFNIIINELKKYNGEKLLMFLMKKHEAIIQRQSFGKISYPMKVSCLDKFYDVQKEYAEENSKSIEVALSLRVLIEFAACILPQGSKECNDDDIDVLLAHAIELITYGAYSDSIKFGISDPEMGKLPSGRLGISREFENETLRGFRDDYNSQELYSYSDRFSEYFDVKRKATNSRVTGPSMERINKIFQEEWGVGLTTIDTISYGIATRMIHNSVSVEKISEKELAKFLSANSDFSDSDIVAYFDLLAFPDREDILKAPKGYESWEVYPWRYNRRLSYLLKPIIKYKSGEHLYYLISARHLLMASENYLSLFFKGTLKINRKNKKLLDLLSEINNYKGKRFRDQVLTWLNSNTKLRTFSYEVKISPSGFFQADSDRGDIDILAIDDEKKIVYSIECKNTSMSKTAYDFKSEIDNYLGTPKKQGLISRHLKRDQWLQDNRKLVYEKLKISNYQIKSLVISKNILPLKYMKRSSMLILSFHDLKLKGL